MTHDTEYVVLPQINLPAIRRRADWMLGHRTPQLVRDMFQDVGITITDVGLDQFLVTGDTPTPGQVVTWDDLTRAAEAIAVTLIAQDHEDLIAFAQAILGQEHPQRQG